MPQFDIFTFFIQTMWFTIFFFIFYFSYIKFILHPTFIALNIRIKIVKMSSNLVAKMKKTLLSNSLYSKIVN